MTILVSILMPVYNERNYVREALGAILNGVYKCFEVEIVVVDDCSTDNTWDIVKDISEKDARVRLYRNESKGKVSAFNYAYNKSSGDVYVLCAGDDLIEAKNLEQRIICISDSNLASISMCKIRMFSAEKKFDGLIFPKNKKKGSMAGGAIAFNRKMGNKIFPIPNSLPNEDTWVKCFIRFHEGHNVHVPVVGLNYRIHSGNSVQLGSTFAEYSMILAKRNLAYSKFLEMFGKSLSSEKKHILNDVILLERYRLQNRLFGIVFMGGLSLHERISAIFCSNRFFYFIRQTLYKLLAGR